MHSTVPMLKDGPYNPLRLQFLRNVHWYVPEIATRFNYVDEIRPKSVKLNSLVCFMTPFQWNVLFWLHFLQTKNINISFIDIRSGLESIATWYSRVLLPCWNLVAFLHVKSIKLVNNTHFNTGLNERIYLFSRDIGNVASGAVTNLSTYHVNS